MPYPNLIRVEGLGTLPDHCICFLGKLLGQLPIFSLRLFVSPWQLECATSRNARSFCLRRLIVHCGALSSSRPPRTHDVRVVDTSLIYYSHLSNFMPVVTRKSKCVFAPRYFQEASATQGYIRQFSPLLVAGDRLHRRPPQLMLQVVVILLSTRLIRV